MHNRRNIILKLLLSAVILGILLPRLGIVTLWQALFAAALVTLAGYISDFIVLTKISGPEVIAIDIILNTFVIWVVQFITPFMYLPFATAFIVSLFLTLAEVVLHVFRQRQMQR